MARQARCCMRDERLQVQYSILLLKKCYCGKASRTLPEGQQVTGLVQYFAIKNNHSWEARQDTAAETRSYKFKIVSWS